MTGASRFSVDALRDAIRKRVAETSLREVAAEIGLPSYSALNRFLHGDTKSPHPRTRTLMAEWYYRRNATQPGVQRQEIELAKALLHAWAEDRTKAKTVRERRRREIRDEFSESE